MGRASAIPQYLFTTCDVCDVLTGSSDVVMGWNGCNFEARSGKARDFPNGWVFMQIPWAVTVAARGGWC